MIDGSGEPGGQRKNTPDRKRHPEGAVKSWLQGNAEQTLNKLIFEGTKVVFRMDVDNKDTQLGLFVRSMGLGKWGLLLSPESGHRYKLWFIDCKGLKIKGTISFVSLDLSSKELHSVAVCIERGVVNDQTSPPRKMAEEDSEARKLVVLIQNFSHNHIYVDNIDDGTGFLAAELPPLDNLLKK